MVDHYFVPYPEAHAKAGSCLRCGKLPGEHPEPEGDFLTLAAAASESVEKYATIHSMNYTDSIAHATGALMAARAQIVEEAINIPRDGDWTDGNLEWDLEAVCKSLLALGETLGSSGLELDPWTPLNRPSFDNAVKDINEGRIARWG